MTSPISYHNFNPFKDNKVYFYFHENCEISLANMFRNIKKLINFYFNNDYINDFNIVVKIIF